MLDPKTFSQSSHPIFDTNKVESTNSNLDDEDGYYDELEYGLIIGEGEDDSDEGPLSP